MLGALSLGDIGKHFPDTDSTFKGIDSKILLKKTYDLIKEAGYELVNVDTTVCLQQPKLRPHIDQMRLVIAEVLKLQLNQVSIKATTTEKMGYVGREEGIEAHAVVLLGKS